MSISVSGNLKDVATGVVSSGSWVRFVMRGTAGNQPFVSGTALLAPAGASTWYKDFTPDVNGAISGTLYSKSEVSVGGQTGVISYGMQIFVNSGVTGPEVLVNASQNININNPNLLSVLPVVAAPTGDSTYFRLDGTNSPITGPFTALGSSTFTQLQGCQVVNASQSFAAALAAVGSNGCIQVSPGTYTVSANAAIPVGVSLGFSTGGQLSIANAVTLTINGPLIAPLSQVFTYVGTGTVALGVGAVGSGVYPQWWGAVADGVTDSAPATRSAIAALPSSVGTILFARGKYRWNTSVTASSGVTLAGVDQPERWRLGQVVATEPTQVLYYGTGAALSLVCSASQLVDTVTIRNLQFDGFNASGAVDGFLFQATAAGSAIEGLSFQNVTVRNFPRNQIRLSGVVFDVSSYRLTLHNQARAVTGPLFYLDDLGTPGPSQITFDDAYILPYTASQTGVVIESSQDTRFIGGTISPQVTTPGANGIFAVGGLDIYGTHFEGLDGTPTTNFAVRYVGSNGARIHPDFSNFFGYQIQIGMPLATTYTTAAGTVLNTATAARGAVIGGNISNGTTAAVLISAGGSRTGTIIETLGFSGGAAATISDLRLTSDGVAETTSFHNNSFSNPSGVFPAIAGGADVGKVANPYGNLWLGTAATNNFKFQPAATAAARVISMPDPLGAVNMPYVIASGTSTLTSNATLAAVTSQAAITTAATGAATTDAIEWSYASAPSAGDSLCIVGPYVTANNVNFVRSNPTAAAQNVSAIVINWRVIR